MFYPGGKPVCRNCVGGADKAYRKMIILTHKQHIYKYVIELKPYTDYRKKMIDCNTSKVIDILSSIAYNLQMQNIYTDTNLRKFACVSRGLSFYLGEEWGFVRHGSGLFVRYRDKLFFLCCKHSFFSNDGKHTQRYFYNDLCFFEDGGKLTRPTWDRIVFSAKKNGEPDHHVEDLIIHELKNPAEAFYQKAFKDASIIDNHKCNEILKLRRGIVYTTGYPNITGGNIDEETRTVTDQQVGRYVQIKCRTESDYDCTIDVNGLVDDSEMKGSYGIDGMSGSPLLTCDEEGTPILVGMITAGTVDSKRIIATTSGFIAYVLDSYLDEQSCN